VIASAVPIIIGCVLGFCIGMAALSYGDWRDRKRDAANPKPTTEDE
jgi:hypothetical protein